jgi:hypothetical protein
MRFWMPVKDVLLLDVIDRVSLCNTAIYCYGSVSILLPPSVLLYRQQHVSLTSPHANRVGQ